MKKYCFGVDVGGTAIKMGLFLEDGQLVSEWKIPTRIGENGKYFFDDIAASVLEKIKEKGIARPEVLGVGIAVPCPVREDGSTGIGTNIRTRGVKPEEELRKRLDGMKVKVSNDANAAGLGELWMGAGRGCSSLCMVTLGTGVGCALIQDSRIITGSHGTGGELGHICIEPAETESCGCGGKGCLEQYASATGIVRVAKRLVQSGDVRRPVEAGKENRYPDSRIAQLGEELSAKDVCDLAREGDELACAALDYSADCLARGLAAVALITDPEIFVIGGGVAEAGDVILSRLKERVAVYTAIQWEMRSPIVQAELGNRAGIYGAAASVRA